MPQLRHGASRAQRPQPSTAAPGTNPASPGCTPRSVRLSALRQAAPPRRTLGTRTNGLGRPRLLVPGGPARCYLRLWAPSGSRCRTSCRSRRSNPTFRPRIRGRLQKWTSPARHVPGCPVRAGGSRAATPGAARPTSTGSPRCHTARKVPPPGNSSSPRPWNAPSRSSPRYSVPVGSV